MNHRNYTIHSLALTAAFILTCLFESAPVFAQNTGANTSIVKEDVLAAMKKVTEWQHKNPTGKGWNTWDYAPFYAGIMAAYKLQKDQKYFSLLMEMGDKVEWLPRARPYDANVFAITQVFYEMYELTGEEYMIDKSNFLLEAPMHRRLENDVTFDGNKYWWEWWTWCDALFMAPPAYARAATVLDKPGYMKFMVQRWWETSDYLYSPTDSLYFRDDRFFNLKSKNGEKIFWSRGNGWVVGGLARLLTYMPMDYPGREKFENQFVEMCTRLTGLQTEGGYWGQSLLDTEFYPQKESSGTAFFLFGMMWGVNNGLLDEERFLPVIEKGWKFLNEAVHPSGKLGYVQEVGDSPTDVSFDDSESYGAGAFLLAGSEIYQFLNNGQPASSGQVEQAQQDRAYTVGVMRKIADPVLNPLSEDRLKKVLPRKDWETNDDAFHTSPLQAFGRTLSGMAPWLSLGGDDSGEGKLREKYINLCLKGLKNATDPKAADYMFEKRITQHIVHTAFVAYPLLMAEEQLWEPLSKKEKANVIAALKSHRGLKPWESNWLLFSAIIESAIWKFTGECDLKPVEYAVNKHMEWYLGDGTYGDGPQLHWDYYNSYVIHPMLLEVLKVCKEKGHKLGSNLPEALERGVRYAEILEHLISPEGTYPVIGRSSVYRFAAFQQLGYMGFRWELPESLNPGATRAALTAVIRNMTEAPGTFDENGWLNAGIVGEQVNARDPYNYTGALYMVAMGLMHLGIPPDAPFWTEKRSKWFQQRIWSGEDVPNPKN